MTTAKAPSTRAAPSVVVPTGVESSSSSTPRRAGATRSPVKAAA